MALTRVATADLTSSLSNTITTASTTAAAAAAALPPKIANVQVANSSWSLLDDTAVDTAGGYVIINGSGFNSGCIVTIDGTAATAVTRVSNTVLQVEVPAKAANSYTVYVVNEDGGTALKLNGVTYSAFPVWSTGTTLTGGAAPFTASISLSATEGADTITYANVGALPAGLSLAANGLLTGSLNPATETTYTFTVKATDAENQDVNRTFSVTITVPASWASLMTGGFDDYNRTWFYPMSAKTKSNGKISLTGQVLVACGYTGIQSRSVVVAQLNAQGNVEWSTSFGSSNADASYKSQSIMLPTGNSSGPDYTLYSLPSQLDIPLGFVDTQTFDASGAVYTAFMDVGGKNPGRGYVVKNNDNGTIAWQIETRMVSGTNTAVTGLTINPGGNTLLIQCSNATSIVDTDTYNINGIVLAHAANGTAISTYTSQMALPARIIYNTTGSHLFVCGSHYGGIAMAKANSVDFDANLMTVWGFRDYGSATRKLTDLVCDSSDDVYAIGHDTSGEAPRLLFLKANGTSGSIMWQYQIANTTAAQLWRAGGVDIDSTGTFVYISGTLANNQGSADWKGGYIAKVRASNGEVIYQRTLSNGRPFAITDLHVDGDYMIITAYGLEPYIPADQPAGAGVVLRLPTDGTKTGNLANSANGWSGYVAGKPIVYANAAGQFTISNPDISASSCSSIGSFTGGLFTTNILTGANVIYKDTDDNSRLAVSALSNANSYKQVITL